MTLYYVHRTDRVGYDEHDSAVIRARNFEDAEQLVRSLTTREVPGEQRLLGFKFDPPNFTIDQLFASGKRGPILRSFNAG